MLYGDHKHVLPISTCMTELTAHLKRRDFKCAIMDLVLPDGSGSCRVIPRAVEYDFKTRKPTYVTFQRWPEDLKRYPQKVPIPIVATNAEFCVGVKAGGSLIYIFDEWTCRVYDEPIPAVIELDASPLEIGVAVKLSSVKLPEHVKPMPRGQLVDPPLIKVIK